MKKILVIQTAFIGDAILATALLESIHTSFKDNVQLDVLVRKGNESLFANHPFIHKTLVWDKKSAKYKNLSRLISSIRATRYSVVFNLQRFGSTGLLTWLSKAEVKIGYQKNPFSFSYTHKIKHEIGNGKHEIERNHELLRAYKKDIELCKPKLYPNLVQKSKVNELVGTDDFYVFAPSSVWFTKQLPKEKWIELLNLKKDKGTLFLIGAPNDKLFLDELIAESNVESCQNLAGRLDLLESAYLMQKAVRSYVNDSAPMHLASAMNAAVTVFFCSTIPAFGFGPLSDTHSVIEITKELSCRPCGLHGYKSCPKGHFKCGREIEMNEKTV